MADMATTELAADTGKETGNPKRARALRVLGGGFEKPGNADGQLWRASGLRFTADGAGVAVADEAEGPLDGADDGAGKQA